MIEVQNTRLKSAWKIPHTRTQAQANDMGSQRKIQACVDHTPTHDPGKAVDGFEQSPDLSQDGATD